MPPVTHMALLLVVDWLAIGFLELVDDCPFSGLAADQADKDRTSAVDGVLRIQSSNSVTPTGWD